MVLGRGALSYERDTLAGSAAILCAEGLDVIREEAWSFYRTISGGRLCWELKEPKGPKWGMFERWGKGALSRIHVPAGGWVVWGGGGGSAPQNRLGYAHWILGR